MCHLTVYTHAPHTNTSPQTQYFCCGTLHVCKAKVRKTILNEEIKIYYYQKSN